MTDLLREFPRLVRLALMRICKGKNYRMSSDDMFACIVLHGGEKGIDHSWISRWLWGWRMDISPERAG